MTQSFSVNDLYRKFIPLKKSSGCIKIAGKLIPSEQFFLKRMICMWKFDLEVNTYREM